jgi:hypothetical protein
VKKPALAAVGLALALLILAHAAGASSYLTGKVTSGPSNPARSLWVMVFDGSQLKGRSLTGDDGRFYVGGLDQKAYTVVVRKQASGSNLSSQPVTLPHDQVHNIVLP